MSVALPDTLEHVLQVHLANDTAAVAQLPSTLQALGSPEYGRSPHLRKFCTRLHALIHSKEPAPRWAGMVIAQHCFALNREAMLDHAHGWVTVVLPSLSRKEPAALWKAAIALLDTVFVTTAHLSEFQRQVTNPNASKFGLALLALADKGDEDLLVISLATLARLIAAFPTLLRPLHPQASSLSLRLLQGRYPCSQPIPLVTAAAQLHSVLHLTGGKVGGAALWKKSVDDAIGSANMHLGELRSTFSDGQRRTAQENTAADPVVVIPHALDALRATVTLLCHLLRSPSTRPLIVPVGSVVQLCSQLLQATQDEPLEHSYDKPRRAMEVTAVPTLWALGGDLVCQLTHSIGRHLSGSLSQLLPCIIAQFERQSPLSHKTPFLRAFVELSECCYPTDDSILLSRTVRSLLPALSRLVTAKATAGSDTKPEGDKKGKKRKAYEGEELFSVGGEVLFSTIEDGQALLLVLEVIRCSLRNPALPTHLQSLGSRLLLTFSIELPSIAASALSVDESLHGRVLARVLDLCQEVGSRRATLNQSVSMVVRSFADATLSPSAGRDLDLLLRPRFPPVPRSGANLESDILTAAERTQELAVAATLGLAVAGTSQPPGEHVPVTQDEAMVVDPPIPSAPVAVVRNAPVHAPTLPVPQAAAAAPVFSKLAPPPAEPSQPSWLSRPTENVVKGAVAPAKPVIVETAKRPAVAPAGSDDDDDDEPMPAIDMRSDSEDE